MTSLPIENADCTSIMATRSMCSLLLALLVLLQAQQACALCPPWSYCATVYTCTAGDVSLTTGSKCGSSGGGKNAKYCTVIDDPSEPKQGYKTDGVRR